MIRDQLLIEFLDISPTLEHRDDRVIALMGNSAHITVPQREEDVTRPGSRVLVERTRLEEINRCRPESLLVALFEIIREDDIELEVRPRRENYVLLIVTKLRQFHYALRGE